MLLEELKDDLALMHETVRSLPNVDFFNDEDTRRLKKLSHLLQPAMKEAKRLWPEFISKGLGFELTGHLGDFLGSGGVSNQTLTLSRLKQYGLVKHPYVSQYYDALENIDVPGIKEWKTSTHNFLHAVRLMVSFLTNLYRCVQNSDVAVFERAMAGAVLKQLHLS